MQLNTTEELIADIRAGKIVILMDDEDRENEGDLVLAADCVRAEDINFMARYGRGLICLTLTRDHCKRLNLPLMAGSTYSSHSTNFTVSIEAAAGVTTGISAADRAHTIKTAVTAEASPSDLTQPGHVFPLMAHPGGVLARAGHTEAGCDLARLAGLTPAAVIVEILKEDGSMARRPDLELFAQEHDFKIGTIAELIRYRMETEKSVERVVECELPTEFGNFHLVTYRDTLDGNLHFAMTMGRIQSSTPALVRVHLQNPICDLTGTLREDCGWPLRDALRRVAEEGMGVVVILSNQIDPLEIVHQLRAYSDQNGAGLPVKKQNIRDLRTIGLGAQILSDMGVRKMRVLSAPKRMHAISGFGLEVIEYVN